MLFIIKKKYCVANGIYNALQTTLLSLERTYTSEQIQDHRKTPSSLQEMPLGSSQPLHGETQDFDTHLRSHIELVQSYCAIAQIVVCFLD
jgi:hypothetical protein